MFWQILLAIILAPIAVIAVGFTICLTIGIIKGIVKAFKRN